MKAKNTLLATILLLFVAMGCNHKTNTNKVIKEATKEDEDKPSASMVLAPFYTETPNPDLHCNGRSVTFENDRVAKAMVFDCENTALDVSEEITIVWFKNDMTIPDVYCFAKQNDLTILKTGELSPFGPQPISQNSKVKYLGLQFGGNVAAPDTTSLEEIVASTDTVGERVYRNITLCYFGIDYYGVACNYIYRDDLNVISPSVGVTFKKTD